MGLPTVNKFCCCCRLETGGLVIGWLWVVASVLIILNLIGIIAISSALYNHPDVNSEPLASTVFVTIIVIVSIYIVYYIIVFVGAILLIQATRKRDHTKMMLFMILMAIGIILAFLQMISMQLAGLALAIISAAINIYFFICIYSLYDLLRNESMSGQRHVHFQPAQPYIHVNQTQPQPYVFAQQPVVYGQPHTYLHPPQIIVQPATPSDINQVENVNEFSNQKAPIT